MRILRVIARLNVGGPARHVVLLDRGLSERGHTTLLVHGSVGADEASLEHLAADGRIETIKLPELGRRISPLDDARALVKLVTILFRHAPDVVHTHTAKAGTLGRIAASIYNVTRSRRRRSVVVHTFHGHVLESYFRPSVSIIVRLAERCLAVVTDRIVTISPQQHRDITERFRIASSSQTVTISLGLDLRALSDLPLDAPSYRGELGIAAHDFVVGYVGRLAPIKDLPMLVQAFAVAHRDWPDSWLVLAGDGSGRPELEALALRLEVADRVRFLGWTENLPRLYATLDLCALSSLNEGTPVAIIEAMAAGKPVAATAVGGVADVVRDGETGLLVPPGDVEALAGAIVRLARDPTERARMGAAARQSVARRYTVETLIIDLERLYNSILAEKRGVSST